jgi:hypothetical protein
MKPTLLLLLAPFASLTAENITLEAESFTKQTLAETRKWEIQSNLPGASGGKSIQVLPDTRKSHVDKLIHGENFSEEPGKMAVLEYPFHAKEPGRYFVWARVFSRNSEDNALITKE